MKLGDRKWDAVVVGGGPGGSTAAALLADVGRKVLVIDREHFPRFHIGESLLPCGNAVLRRLGIYDRLEAEGFVRKFGVDFMPSSSVGMVRVNFAEFFPEAEQPGPAFNVERSRFDDLLLENARSRGATVVTGASAKTFREHEDHVEVEITEGETTHRVTAPWLIDASGLGHFVGKALKLPRVELGVSPKIVCFGYFKGVYRSEGRESGHVGIVRFDHGWFWFIPISDELTSVGMVRHLSEAKANASSMEELFAQALIELPEIRFRMKRAEQVGELRKVSDYTTRYKTVAGRRHFIVGDAANFIDPIFSSGVMLAFKSAALAADLLNGKKAFTAPLTPSEQRTYQQSIFRDADTLLPMIKAFYDQRGFEVFMNPHSAPKIFAAMGRLLAGKLDPTFPDRMRIQGFYLATWLQRYTKVAPRIPLQ